MELNDLFLKYNSPKSSENGNFAYIYENLFCHARKIPIRILEIGVLYGSSTKAFKEWMHPESFFVGLDLMDKTDKSSIVEIGDQTDETFAEYVHKKYGVFDVIIEDGGTQQDMKIRAFENYFPFVAPQGKYIIEHTQHAYETKNKGGLNCQGSFIEYLKNIIDSLHFFGIAERGRPYDRGNVKTILQANYELSYLERHIANICFYHGVCVITKR